MPTILEAPYQTHPGHWEEDHRDASDIRCESRHLGVFHHQLVKALQDAGADVHLYEWATPENRHALRTQAQDT